MTKDMLQTKIFELCVEIVSLKKGFCNFLAKMEEATNLREKVFKEIKLKKVNEEEFEILVEVFKKLKEMRDALSVEVENE